MAAIAADDADDRGAGGKPWGAQRIKEQKEWKASH